MNRKRIAAAAAIAVALVLGFLTYGRIIPDKYTPSDDEIVLHIRLDTKEDIGLLIFDYSADGSERSGGISNADKSLMKHDSDIIIVLDKQDLGSTSDTVALLMRFRVITEYTAPNYENVYTEDITQYIDAPVSWEARFGEAYSMALTGDKTNGYSIRLLAS